MGRDLTILVAEDDPNDALLLKLAFGPVRVDRVHFVGDGKEVIDYLRGESPYDDRAKHPLPDLLVLDLKMPGTTGFDVLEWLQQRPDLTPMNVAVLSGSESQPEINQACAMGANFFIVKSVDFERLVGMAKGLIEECRLRLALQAPGQARTYAHPAARSVV